VERSSRPVVASRTLHVPSMLPDLLRGFRVQESEDVTG